MAQLEYTIHPSDSPASDSEREAILANPGFGKHFTDHMVTIEWNEEEGWHNAQVRKFEPIPLSPALTTLHYGQSIFEGIKAYRQPDGHIKSFRPEQNAARFARSAHRLAMPALPEEEFLESIRQLVTIDQAWVPQPGEESLYLRPLMFATDETLGVHPGHTYLYILMASPAGAYFANGVKPVTVWITDDYVRAAPGGTGAAKCAGNYAASLLAQEQAEEKGCDQVVWLDAIERNYIEEMGGMNIMFVYGSGADAEVVTPALSGSLLPGVTRDSILQVARDLGYGASEKKVTKQQWADDVASGAMTESLACGTAAVITPIGHVKGNGLDFVVNNAEPGTITMQLREHLTGIQRGTVEDTHGWLYTLV
ncbi:MAG: branched-chain amino acid aminotransferase [Corynebacterium sp.]|nr:branched-chain amino acid aminotransferase [Corynebacterium sp.]